MTPDAPRKDDDSRGPTEATQTGVPAEIGGFRILRRLGSGGMAVVYAALQDRPRRTVAIKVLKSTVATDQSRRWFKREVEILGRLHHPNIAQVHGAGTCTLDGEELPYFVMEYVPGAETVIEHIARKELTTRDRLKLFVKVCAAVEHGHRSKIIHRDLKPANILIDRYGAPKVIDFGIARVADLDLEAQTMHTEAARLVGTLQYMSSEQLEPRPVDLDARCDVYALGTLLYRILTGRPPHDLKGLSVVGAARVVREEQPARPSAIKPDLRGDLETIILKAMEKDRTRRYRNAGSLGRDLVRYMAHKPIHARRAGPWYRARLTLRRQRPLVAAAVTLAAVFAVALGVIAVSAVITSRRQSGSPEPVGERPRPPAAVAPPDDEEPERPFVLDGHTARIIALSFDPAGDHLVSTSQDHTAVQWDLGSRSQLFAVSDHDGPVGYAGFSADGALLATAAVDGSVLVVDSIDNTVRYTLRARCGRIFAFAFDAPAPSSPGAERNAPRVALGCEDLALHLHDLESGRRRLIRGTRGVFTAVTIATDGLWTAAGDEQGTVLATGPTTHRLRMLRRPVAGLAFVGGVHERLIGVDESGMAMHWRPGTPETDAERFRAGADPVSDVGFDPACHWMAVASGDTVVIWSMRDLERVAEITHADRVLAVAVDSTGRRCAVGDVNGIVTVYRISADDMVSGER